MALGQRDGEQFIGAAAGGKENQGDLGGGMWGTLDRFYLGSGEGFLFGFLGGKDGDELGVVYGGDLLPDGPFGQLAEQLDYFFTGGF